MATNKGGFHKIPARMRSVNRLDKAFRLFRWRDSGGSRFRVVCKHGNSNRYSQLFLDMGHLPVPGLVLLWFGEEKVIF